MEGPVPAERLWPSHWTGALSRAWHCVPLRCLGTNMTNHQLSVFPTLAYSARDAKDFITFSFIIWGFFYQSSFFFFFAAARQLRTHSYYLLKRLFTQKPKRRPDAKNANRQTTWWFVLWMCVDCGWWTYHFQSILSQKYFGKNEKLFPIIAVSDWQLPGYIFR